MCVLCYKYRKCYHRRTHGKTDPTSPPTFRFPFVLVCRQFLLIDSSIGSPWPRRTRMTSPGAETDSKPIFIIIIKILYLCWVSTWLLMNHLIHRDIHLSTCFAICYYLFCLVLILIQFTVLISIPNSDQIQQFDSPLPILRYLDLKCKFNILNSKSHTNESQASPNEVDLTFAPDRSDERHWITHSFFTLKSKYTRITQRWRWVNYSTFSTHLLCLFTEALAVIIGCKISIYWLLIQILCDWTVLELS